MMGRLRNGAEESADANQMGPANVSSSSHTWKRANQESMNQSHTPWQYCQTQCCTVVGQKPWKLQQHIWLALTRQDKVWTATMCKHPFSLLLVLAVLGQVLPQPPPPPAAAAVLLAIRWSLPSAVAPVRLLHRPTAITHNTQTQYKYSSYLWYV